MLGGHDVAARGGDEPSLVDANNRAIWNRIWRGHWYSENWRRVYRAAAKVEGIRASLTDIGLKETSRVIEIGCGSGHFLHKFAQETRLRDGIFGCDWSDAAIKLARRTFGSSKPLLAVCDANQLPFNGNTFSLVLLICVVEHIERKQFILEEAKRVLSYGGHIVVFYSNSLSAFAFERKLKSFLFKWPFGYQDELTIDQTVTLLGNAFSVKEIGVVHGGWDFPVLSLIDRLVGFLLPTWGRYNFIVAELQHD